MSPTERRALLMLLALGLAGQGVRWWVGRPGEPPGQVELLAALPPKSPLAHRDSVLALARPLEPGERIDADRATAPELARLPRVGLALAKTIVAEREAKGPFGSLQGLDRVPGIGPGLLAAIAPHVTFSLPAGPSFTPASGQFARAAPPFGGAPPRTGARRRPSAKPQYRHAFRSRQSAGHRPCSRGGDLAGTRGARAVRFGGGALAGAGTGPRGHQPAARPSGGPVSSASAQAT